MSTSKTTVGAKAPTNRTPRFREIAAAIKAERRLIAAYLRVKAEEGTVAEALLLGQVAKLIIEGAHYDVPTS